VAEILRFDTNVPVEVALRFSDGKHVEGRYGDQVMYSLEGDKIIYVPPVVEHRIRELHIDKGDRFQICKTEVKKGNRRSIEWRVARVDAAIEQAPQQPVVRPTAAVSVPDYQNALNNGNGSTHGSANADANANGTVKLNGISALEISRNGCFSDMDQTLMAAVEIAQHAEAHAATHNYSLRFTSEDVRAIGLSLFIARTREGGTR
jgi:hypothetical protein